MTMEMIAITITSHHKINESANINSLVRIGDDVEQTPSGRTPERLHSQQTKNFHAPSGCSIGHRDHPPGIERGRALGTSCSGNEERSTNSCTRAITVLRNKVTVKTGEHAENSEHVRNCECKHTIPFAPRGGTYSKHVSLADVPPGPNHSFQRPDISPVRRSGLSE